MDPVDEEAEERVAAEQSSLLTIMESVGRVFLSGFAGAMAGLSFARQSSSSSSKATSAAIAAARRRARVYGDTSLPIAWAVACMGFAGMVETTRLVSPMSLVLPDHSQRHARTVGDYTIGGAAAGMTFRGMQVRTARSRVPSLTPRILSGLGPGITLGLVAGALVAASDFADEKVAEEQERIPHNVQNQ